MLDSTAGTTYCGGYRGLGEGKEAGGWWAGMGGVRNWGGGRGDGGDRGGGDGKRRQTVVLVSEDNQGPRAIERDEQTSALPIHLPLYLPLPAPPRIEREHPLPPQPGKKTNLEILPIHITQHPPHLPSDKYSLEDPGRSRRGSTDVSEWCSETHPVPSRL